MPGAWELPTPNVYVSTLTREIVTTKWASSYRNMQLPPGSVCTFVAGMPFDHARNTACEAVLNNGFQWLFFLDDDVCIPPDTIHRLVAKNADIISGLYYRRAPPIVPVARVINEKKEVLWVESWNPPGATIEVDMVGAGCMLIHRRVLEKMSKPWFEWELSRPDPLPLARPALRGSEDFAFCLRAKLHGFKIYLDTSIQCQHIGLGESQIGGGFVPSAL
jgi:hypothetical protein